jgi:hypothetical protein
MPPSAVPSRLVLTQHNSQLIQIWGMRDALTNNFLNSATLKATLLDANREPVTGCIDIVMNYVSNSNGDYTGVVDSTFSPDVGSEYTMVIDGGQGASHLHMEIPTQVTVRTN